MFAAWGPSSSPSRMCTLDIEIDILIFGDLSLRSRHLRRQVIHPGDGGTRGLLWEQRKPIEDFWYGIELNFLFFPLRSAFGKASCDRGHVRNPFSNVGCKGTTECLQCRGSFSCLMYVAV